MNRYKLSKKNQHYDKYHDVEFTMAKVAGWDAMLTGTKDGCLVSFRAPINQVVLIQQEAEQMAFPKHQNKQTLLAAVDDLNKVCGTKLQVKSKSAQVICDTLTAAIEGIDHTQLVEGVSDETLETLVLFNIIADFVDEDYEFSENFEESVESITDKTTQATEVVVFSVPSIMPEEGVEEDTPAEKTELELLTEKLKDDTLKKKKRKKIEKKIKKLLDESLADIPEEKEAPKKAPKKRAPAAPKVIPEKITLPRPGIIRSIVEIIAKKPHTIEQIHKKMVKMYPDKNPDSMLSTIKVQIGGKKHPLRVEYERGVHVAVEGEGDKRTVHVTDDLPEYVKPEPQKKVEPKKKAEEKPAETEAAPEPKKEKKKKKKGKKKK